MRLASLALVLSLAIPFSTGCTQATGGDHDPVASASDDIKNGTSAAAYPEAVLVDLYQNGQLNAYCSGSLIAPQVVMTAGHCVFQFDSWQIHAPYVNQTASASSGTTYDWTDTQETVDPSMHDIGLIFLNTPITLSSYPTLASSPLAAGSSVVNVGRICSGQLETTKLCVSSNVTVNMGSQYGFPYDYEAQDVIESGDSGGPDEQTGTHLIVSVNSGGGSTEVLARVDLLYSWIQGQITMHGGTGSSSSTTGSGVTTGSGAGGGGSQDCDTCAQDAQTGACSSQANACGNDQNCVDLNNCLGNCSDQTCANNCGSQYGQQAVNELNAFDNCICDTACTTQCASECGSSSSTTSGAGAGTTTGVGVGVGTGVGVGSGVTTGSLSSGSFGAGVGGAGSGPSGAGGGSGGGNNDDQNAGANGGCNFGTGSDSAAWTAALLGLALAAARRRRRS